MALWSEDWSALAARLRDRGIADEASFRRALAADGALLGELRSALVVAKANAAAATLHGRAPRRRRGPSVSPADATAPDGRAVLAPLIERFMNGRKRVTWEGAFARADGTAVDVRATSCLADADDWSTVSHVVEDWTEQKEAQDTADRRDAVLHAVGFAAQRFLGAADWRDEISATLGLLGEAAGVSRVYMFENFDSLSGLVMRQIHEWVAPGVSEQIARPNYQHLLVAGSGYEPWAAAFAAGRPICGHAGGFGVRVRADLADQDIRSIAAVPIFASGRLWGHVGFDQCDRERDWHAVDLEAFTLAAGLIGEAIERSADKAELARQRDLLGAIIDTVPAMVSAKDSDGRYILMNRYQAELYGVTPEAAVGKTAADLLGATYGAETYGFDRQVLDTGEAMVNYEQTYADARGEVRTWLATKAPLREADGTISRVVTVALDISARKQAETRLREALSQAELANRSKSEFLANISHELRTPLNAIIGFSEVMLAGSQGRVAEEHHRDYLRGILDSGRHLLGIVNDLLDLARLDAGRLSMTEGPVRLARVVEASVRIVADRAIEAGVELDWREAADAATVWADERRIKQILLNLLINAIKFTPKGGRVSVSANLATDGDVVVAVADTGIGMTPEDIEIALKPFGQVDRALSRGHGGVGLGLSLSRAMAEMHGGALVVRSECNKGTTVSLRLPPNRLIVDGGRRHGQRATAYQT
ncbi:MAG: ATP-binding protein [Alphaproteobacteria bacterium]